MAKIAPQRSISREELAPRIKSIADTELKNRLLTQLPASRVAVAADREDLEDTRKAQICSVKVLGEGAFGLVDLVMVAPQADGPPLLCVRKKLLTQTSHNKNDPRLEVEFLKSTAGSPFVVEMWTCVLGAMDCTLLLEYCPYGSLDKLLLVVSNQRSLLSNACLTWFSDKVLGRERYVGFHEHEAKFYAACCVLGLEWLRERNILHRDLKPSNLLLAENGYVKLGDLGLCKKLAEGEIAHSQVGTPGYMAPEVMHKERKTVGYSWPADMWSLGIMIWELVDGLPPRWAPMSWYWTPTIHFPERFSKELQTLLTGLLDKDQATRLKLQDLRKQAWFADVDWAALAEQRLPAPRLPEMEDVHIHARVGTVSL